MKNENTLNDKISIHCLVLCLPLFIVLLLTGCGNNDSQDWKTAQNENTISAFQTYLKKHPESIYSDKAKKSIDDLEWKQVSMSGNFDIYADYLLKHRNSSHINDARQAMWPPHLTSSLSTDQLTDNMKLELLLKTPIKWLGSLELYSTLSNPAGIDKFSIEGGILVSRLGNIEKRAYFTDWRYIYKDDDSKDIVGWGPCLTKGEVILPNIFIQDKPPHGYIANKFQAEDFGSRYTLIVLHSENKESLCFKFDEPPLDIAFSGGTKKGRGQVSGTIEDPVYNAEYELFGSGLYNTYKNVSEPMFKITASYNGAIIKYGNNRILKKSDGWYLGKVKIR